MAKITQEMFDAHIAENKEMWDMFEEYAIKYYGHRLAWLLHYGTWPEGVIDHINRDKTDNRISNLRDTTTQVNNLNTDSLGVHYCSNRLKWVAQFRGSHLGRYRCKTAARFAYLKAKREFMNEVGV